MAITNTSYDRSVCTALNTPVLDSGIWGSIPRSRTNASVFQRQRNSPETADSAGSSPVRRTLNWCKYT
jgi:hypothetical protein